MKSEKEYPSFCCQKCGERIGYLGRFVEWIFFGLIKHDCREFKDINEYRVKNINEHRKGI